MLAFRRTFYVEEERNEQYADLYKAVTNSLRETLASLFPAEEAETLFDNWPGIEDQAEGEIRLKVSEWAPAAGQASRLLETELEIGSAGESWRIKLVVGQPEIGPVVVYEEVYWQGTGREIPLADYPDVISFLRHFSVKNIEGHSSSVIPLRKNKVQNFISFLQSPDRQLSVVYYAMQRRLPDCTQPEAERVQEKLWGLAYVVEAQDRDTVEQFNNLLDTHPTFFGALRLYMPYYQSSDSSWQHSFWPCKREPEEVIHEVLNRVARESVLTEPNSTVVSLREQRRNFARNEALKLKQEAIRLRSDSNDAKIWEELAAEREDQYVALEEGKKELEAMTVRLQDEVRRLNWQLNKRWQYNEDAIEKKEQEVTPRLFLSETAMEYFDSLAPSERNHWEQHLFPKLLQRELRNAQSETLSHSKNGSAFVYPRSRSNNGRRVIYFPKSDDVYVCEIFTASDHDKYNDLRTNGIDRNDYTDFQELEITNETDQ